MPGKVWVTVEGLEPLLRKLRGRPLYAEPLRRALSEAGDLGLAHAQQRAPQGTSGRTVARLKNVMDTRPVPQFAKVLLQPMPLRKGFRYPGALEGGARYHYRTGPRAGQQTRGWWSGVVALLQAPFASLLKRAEREIEAAWER